MAIGTALLVIFGVWLLVAFPRAVLRVLLGLVGLVGVTIAAMYVWHELDRPRQQREEAARHAREQAAEARIRAEEATLLRDRETYRSADRWIGAAVDTKHCRYFMDLETMTVQGNGLNVWIKIERPNVEPGVYLSESCYDYGDPRQVFFSCVGQYVGGAWSFSPGMVSEGILRWLQKSPWCAKVIESAKAEEERRRETTLAWQAEQERLQESSRMRQQRLDELWRGLPR